jgi:hypothetical protein
MTRPIEYAAMTTAELRTRIIDTNGDRDAVAELRSRELAANLRGSGRGRDPRLLLEELERLKDGPDLRSPQEKVIATYARYRGRDPRMALLAAHAMRIDQNW